MNPSKDTVKNKENHKSTNTNRVPKGLKFVRKDNILDGCGIVERGKNVVDIISRWIGEMKIILLIVQRVINQLLNEGIVLQSTQGFIRIDINIGKMK